jgi:hypothetical protein
MRFTSQTSSEGVTEQLFTRTFTFGEIPGVLWTPDGAAGGRPLILMGHIGRVHRCSVPASAYRPRRPAVQLASIVD